MVLMTKIDFLNDKLIMPGDWIPIAQEILHQNDTVIVLGKTDSGKTSIILLLAHYLVRRNRKVGLIDADIGQSTFGPPGTIGMLILDSQQLKSGIIPSDNNVFIGAISPEKCIEDFIGGISQLNRICHKDAVDIILIDTSGLVEGSVGIYLKSSLIKKIKPSNLIALQFCKELEPILRGFEYQTPIHIFRLKPYQDISKKNWRERKTHRMKRFRMYFREATLMDFNFSEIQFKGIYYGQGQLWEKKKIEEINQRYQIEVISAETINDRIILILESQQNIPSRDIIANIKKDFAIQHIILLTQPWFKYLLISFNNREGLSNGLGIIKEINFQQKHLKSYIPGNISLNHIVEIKMGQLKVKPDGIELPFMEPETY